MKPASNLKQVALRLPDDLAEWIEQRAELQERSVAFVVREILAAEYEREEFDEQRKKRTRDAKGKAESERS